jgi:uncharacterized protein YycO
VGFGVTLDGTTQTLAKPRTHSTPHSDQDVKQSFADPVAIITAAYAALPSPEDMAGLSANADAAEARGYYSPTEDETLRTHYARYLAVRVSLWEVIEKLRPQTKAVQRKPQSAQAQDWDAFAIAFCAAEIIVRTGEHLIDLARERDIIWQKLDEADQRYGLPRKSFTRLYRQLTSAFRMHGFYEARGFYDAHRDEIEATLERDNLRPIAEVLTTLNLPTASRGDHLRRYRSFVRHSLKRRNQSALRNIIFAAFEAIGSDVADLKIPLVKPINAPKRVTADVIAQIKSQLRPGDVFVTRHDDAMSNLFLPGFWPHSALWLGGEDDILEAKKDGVLLRDIEETLQVDAFVVLRPNLTPEQIETALARGISHAGKFYDFIFDFRTTDRLVCTEVIYRTYHGIGPIDFQLSHKAGRHCLSAEDLLNQGVGNGWFDVVAIYGIEGDEIVLGERAKAVLKRSFDATFEN